MGAQLMPGTSRCSKKQAPGSAATQSGISVLQGRGFVLFTLSLASKTVPGTSLVPSKKQLHEYIITTGPRG